MTRDEAGLAEVGDHLVMNVRRLVAPPLSPEARIETVVTQRRGRVSNNLGRGCLEVTWSDDLSREVLGEHHLAVLHFERRVYSSDGVLLPEVA